MKRVLVTGASGFVGRWLLPALVEEGVQVCGLALDPGAAFASSRGVPDPAVGIQWRYGDLRDDCFVARAVEDIDPDTVIHLAAVSHVPTAAADPVLAWDVNVTATARLLHHVDRVRSGTGTDPLVLLVGSAEQYGRHLPRDLPLIEEATQVPRTVYAATKAAQEILGFQRFRATGLRVIVVRSFNHSGPGQPSRFLLPALVARSITLAGTPGGATLPVGNLESVRDFLHVRDVVAAYILLCQRGQPGEAYNVASGIGWSVRSVLEKVMARAGLDAVPAADPSLVRPVDVPELVGDPRKLQHATGWRATRSLDDIIDDLFNAETL